MSASNSSSSPEPTVQEPREPKFVVESVEPSQREGEFDKFVIVSYKNAPPPLLVQQQQQQQPQPPPPPPQQPQQQQPPPQQQPPQPPPPPPPPPPQQPQTQPQIPEQRFRVTRSFHEFQFLEQQLFHSGQCLYGYILPPFPQQLNQSRDGAQIKNFDAPSNGKSLPGYGHFVSDEFQLFHWLRHVLQHPVFGHSGLIEPFLTEKNLPPPGKISKPLGIIKSIQDTIDSRKYAHKDCDLFFQNERDWSIKVCELMHLSTEEFNSTINARHSLSQVLAHLSAALCVPFGDNTGLNRLSLQTNLAFSRFLEGYREFVEAETIDGASTLGATLLLWTRFVESEKEMLKQRTCLLVDYETANRNFDRSRYQRRPDVEEAKWNAERAFEKCSDIARDEIKRFQSTRVKDLARALHEYKSSQLAIAREHYEKLSELYQDVTNELKSIDLTAQ